MVAGGLYLQSCDYMNITRDAPNMLKNLPIIPSRTSQNVSLYSLKYHLLFPNYSALIVRK